jgi:hypothetical protein
MDNPPVNGLGFDLRTGIDAGVRRAMADASVKAIVLTGTGARVLGRRRHPRVQLAEVDGLAEPLGS